ncbi:Heterokaryon incompatibility protein 6, OR allele [Pseudocercospora fuligena]|uniref:Heterokaryon incompatibility protein 6, OR allele n=1 Tax=Pseudocercospora fuligena TaxID=685502 RepID=A0A8H6RC15_9PEZI|nr:Heterokaryon incompatibility protein 6, OR allele [Pseudocercospora fuligena]
MCLPQRKLRIWIDAICINQDDLDERDQQVSMMDDVYRQAREVLVWLGPERSSTQSAITSLQKILQCRASSIDLNSVNFDEHSDHLLPEDVGWPAICEFFCTAWFRRLWCVQEFTLARRAVCFRGMHQVVWDDLLFAACWIADSPERMSGLDLESRLTVCMLENIRMYPMVEQPLWSLLVSVLQWRWITTDPRDQIYAILGLANYQNLDMRVRKLLDPDYRLPLARVYANATRAAIMQEDDLFLLSYCSWRHPASDQDGCVSDCPSWVPVYHNRGVPTHSAKTGPTKEESTKAVVDHETAWDTLRIEGSVVDEIGCTRGYIENFCEAKRTAAILADFWDIMMEELVPRSLIPELASRLRTMILVREHSDRQNVTETRDVKTAQDIADFRSFVEGCWPPRVGSPPVELGAHDVPVKRDHEKTARAIWGACWGKELLITRSGRIGMAHPDAQVGDKICVFWNAADPFVMR